MRTHKTKNRLAGFLYEVLRDGCPAGVLEKIVRNEEETGPVRYLKLSNGHLGQYAEELATRLEKVWNTPLPKPVMRDPTEEDLKGEHACCIGHCCVNHGCKYGRDDDCVVALGQIRQRYGCRSGAWCGEPGLFDDDFDDDFDDEAHP